jgi:sporulation protein YlmC with PRC-barrel domain
MDVARSLSVEELKKCSVVDTSGRKVGSIGDLTLNFDGGLRLSRFILAGSVWEELLEDLGVKPDKDPIFDASMIQRMGKEVSLDTSVNSLKTTLDEGAIPEGDIRYSDLRKLDIMDKSGVKVGKTVDVCFETDGAVYLIAGGGFFEEKLEDLGLKDDIDIIVPGAAIESIGDSINLIVSKDQLSLTIDESVKGTDVIKERRMRVPLRSSGFRPQL